MGYVKLYDQDGSLIRKVCGVQVKRCFEMGHFTLGLAWPLTVFFPKAGTVSHVEYFDGQSFATNVITPVKAEDNEFVTLTPT